MTTPLAVLIPHAGLVAAAWLKTLPLGINTDDINAGSYRTITTWHQDQAVTVFALPATPNAYTPLRAPVVQVDIWGRPFRSGSDKVPWNRCLAIGEAIRDYTLMDSSPGLLVVGGDAYLNARALDVTCIQTPYKVTGEASGLARVSMSIQITYVPVYAEESTND